MVSSHLVTDTQLSLQHALLILACSYLSSSLRDWGLPRQHHQGQGPRFSLQAPQSGSDAGKVPRTRIQTIPGHASFNIHSVGLSPQLTPTARALDTLAHLMWPFTKATEFHSITILSALGLDLGLATKQKWSLTSRSLHISGNTVTCNFAQTQICITPCNAGVWEPLG